MNFGLGNGNECLPMRSNTELLRYAANPYTWESLVDDLKKRDKPRFLSDRYQIIESSGSVCSDPEKSDTNKTKVIVCHDLKGNYRNDRFLHDTPKWDDYRFYHWAGIDIFCYFSHEYITIPPIQWINAAHRNGVQIIGTFITEHGNGRNLLEDVLKSYDRMYRIADALVLLAKRLKFDGWFFNVECSLEDDKIIILRDFVKYLTDEVHKNIPNGLVIWYDSICSNGKLAWQNELNASNKMFFDVCDGIFLNYNWKYSNILNVNDLLRDNNVENRRFDVYFGLDVFGRGQEAGFLSHEILSTIKTTKFSAAIFAPGWTYERQDINIDVETGTEICNYNFLQRNDYFWSSLWKHMNTYGIIQLPFYTSLCIGSGKFKNRFGSRVSSKPWFNLGEQHYQPSIPAFTTTYQYYFDDSFDGGSCLRLNETSPFVNRMFVTNFAIPKSGFILSYVHKCDNSAAYDVQMVGVVRDKNTGRCCRINFGSSVVADEKKIGEFALTPLDDPLLTDVIQNLQVRNDRCLPKTNPINGWNVRFYYVTVSDEIDAHVIDIGVQVNKMHGEKVECTMLLGGVAFHEGVYHDADVNNMVPMIQLNNFA